MSQHREESAKSACYGAVAAYDGGQEVELLVGTVIELLDELQLMGLLCEVPVALQCGYEQRKYFLLEGRCSRVLCLRTRCFTRLRQDLLMTSRSRWGFTLLHSEANRWRACSFTLGVCD